MFFQRIFQFFASRFDVIISEIQSTQLQTTYGGIDHGSTYRTPAAAGTSKSSQQSAHFGGSLVSTDPMQVR